MKLLAAKRGPFAVGRKVITFLVLVCFCAASLPLPLATIDALDKDFSQPFPCQNSPCGCKTAEQCWTNCCCSGPAERFAWAEKHGVKPPSYARRPTSSETAQRSQTSGNVSRIAAKEKSTCGEREKSCCKERSIDAASKSTTNAPGNRNGGNEAATKSCGSCCQTSKADDSASQALSSPTKRKIVLSMFAMKCQGKSSAFTLLPWTILATGQRIVMLEHDFGPAHQAVSTDPAPVYSKPDTPPPR